ncbi:MAG: hypothetical protein HQ551_12700 [Desulfobacteraceae bacterium]|nr:hypothetical protein [Desulfobacteraceae bacterium]
MVSKRLWWGLADTAQSWIGECYMGLIQHEQAYGTRMIESDACFRIDEIFREAGVFIAFPQRDTHLDRP